MQIKGATGASYLYIVLALGLALRFVNLQAPLTDKQAWRQTDTAAIARNFYEEGYSLFYPRVDWRGTTPGYVEANFPLYPFLVALLYAAADGVYEWIGRLVAALCSTAAAALLYGLGRRLGMARLGALLAALLYLLFPMSIYYGRTFMPEGLMILLSVGLLWAFARWIDSNRPWDFALAALLAALCFLVKIPTLYLGFPLVALAWVRWGWHFARKPALWLYLVLTLTPAVLWYWHVNLLFEETGLTFGIWNRYGYDKWDHSLLLTTDFYWTLLDRFWHRVYTPVGAVLVLAGLALVPTPPQRREWTLWVWMGGLMLYVFVVPEGNRGLHYYQLPFVPVGALLAGRTLEAIIRADAALARWGRFMRNWKHPWRIVLVGALIVGVAAYSAWAVRPYYAQPNNWHNYYQSCYLVGRILDAKLPPDALLVIGDEDENTGVPHRSQSPTLLYYCHRKGWQITPPEFAPERLDRLAAEGADYFLAAAGFVVDNEPFWQDLLRRGVTIPSAHPRQWHDEAEFMRFVSRQPGADRHFILVSLAAGDE